MKIYLAGKVGKEFDRSCSHGNPEFRSDWRFKIIDQRLSFSGDLAGFSYAGPYLENCHTELNKKGHEAVESSGCYLKHDAQDQKRSDVFEICKKGVLECDILFAWIDDVSCFGTIAEIGMAFSLGKKIIIAFENEDLFDEMWFVEKMGGCFFLNESPRNSLVAGLNYFSIMLPTMPYGEYLKTDHWKEISGKTRLRAGHRCQICNHDDKILHTHHRTYDRRGFEDLDDLICLCENCHAKFHNVEKAA